MSSPTIFARLLLAALLLYVMCACFIVAHSAAHTTRNKLRVRFLHTFRRHQRHLTTQLLSCKKSYNTHYTVVVGTPVRIYTNNCMGFGNQNPGNRTEAKNSLPT
jgi:hypothetical protein